MSRPRLTAGGAKTAVCLALALAVAAGAAFSGDRGDAAAANMVLVKGGTFQRGDVFGEGGENERPTHNVTLSDFHIAKYEVTVGDFERFVQETGYKTSAEGPNDEDARKKISEQFASGNLSREQMVELRLRLLDYSGAGFWDADKARWIGYDPLINWKNPGIKQAADHPVLAVSVDDAMHYCNWLSKKAGLPLAYDLETGAILDEHGYPTLDITAVKGYRLPTEAEWEYAAREGGRKVRFGSGENVAKSSQINFRANAGEYSYFEPGEYRKCTTPVGSLSANSLGLYDMSGNAWEWVSDKFAEYTSEAQTNPYCTEARGHALRGGRWGGDASEARVFHRSSWVRNDRCNNSGFRIAKSN
ncbi:MAG: SUMF1/EgtB/PvdO family nonheme iron enzyme [Candidatus Zixiibacteriota bacterium]|nr:MAG: SUMF1/EgtB/PvdO family nonheme iron enzyme [candidate division Zixibacteria bacterium]